MKFIPYDVWQANPSLEVPPPTIGHHIFEEHGQLELLAERSYVNEAKLEEVVEAYHSSHPRLFEQLAAMAVVRVQSPKIFDDVEGTMHHYYRGAVFALLALEASNPRLSLRDLSEPYVQLYIDQDMISLEQWLLSMRASTIEATQPLRDFISNKYQWLAEEDYMKTAMHIGAQYAYILMAHSRACVEREKEIAWMTRDDELLEGWLEYRENNYSFNAL